MKLEVYSSNDIKMEPISADHYVGVFKLITINSMNKEEMLELYKILKSTAIKITLEPIKDNKKIEEIKINEGLPNNYYIENEFGKKCFLTKHSKLIADKLNELIREVNQLKNDRND